MNEFMILNINNETHLPCNIVNPQFQESASQRSLHPASGTLTHTHTIAFDATKATFYYLTGREKPTFECNSQR